MNHHVDLPGTGSKNPLSSGTNLDSDTERWKTGLSSLHQLKDRDGQCCRSALVYNADPDPACYLNADPDTDPDPGSQTNADPCVCGSESGSWILRLTLKSQKVEFQH